jgi:hypothetical protein
LPRQPSYPRGFAVANPPNITFRFLSKDKKPIFGFLLDPCLHAAALAFYRLTRTSVHPIGLTTEFGHAGLAFRPPIAPSLALSPNMLKKCTFYQVSSKSNAKKGIESNLFDFKRFFNK